MEASEGKHETGPVNPGQVLLNDEEIMWNAYIFLLAGYETTSTALAYTTHCLSLYPDIQERVYDEIIDKIGLDGEITYENVNELNYMDLVINESLRVYPPVPLSVTLSIFLSFPYSTKSYVYLLSGLFRVNVSKQPRSMV